ADNVECTPIQVGRLLYAPTPKRSVVAVDAATGKEVWRFDLGKPEKIGLENAPARRGLEYWKGDAENPARLLFGADNWIYAVDPLTGRPVAGFGDHGRTPIPTGATAGVGVCGHVAITSGLFGDVYGYDVRTGQPLWRFHARARGD